MDTRFLETFVAVVEHGSLAEAARRLGVTPAAVAQRMRALEAEIGAPLILRAGRQVRPSDAGRAILARSRRLLVDVRRLAAAARAGPPVGEMRLGVISTALTGLVPGALRDLSDTIPGIDVFVLPGTSPDLYDALSAGRIDAALLVRPPFAIPKTLEWHLARSEPMVLLCAAERASTDAMTLLRTRPFIRYDRSNWGGRIIDAWMKARRLAPRDWLELDQLEAIAVMVDRDLGVSIVPDWAPPWPEGLRVARLPLPGAAPPRRIGLLWPRSGTSGRAAMLFLEALRRSGAAGGPADHAATR
ncbi:LysR family transcriptional regulator [Amaricoccus solimangrovi]|uniref:LysR family transcriptional regulator n=2 Tax=Amaricoccus solimangrovi TaxID=2589815 RepID=A0A501WHH6_9RHOB|nr:LysR family transcriptional regulator [Amaricoccus solimangrovi]